MIFIPAIVAGVAAIAKPVLVAAGIGAVVGAGTGAVGGAVTSYQDHGELNRQVAHDAAYGAFRGGADGALFGGVFGVGGIILAPIAPIASSAVQPILGIVDDLAKPAIDVVGKVGKPALDVVDDIAGQTIGKVATRVSTTVDDMSHTMGAPSKLVNSANHAKNYRHLADGVCKNSCQYVMYDKANNIYKIGVTKDPATRLATVQRDVGSKVNYVSISPVDDAFGVESSLHRHLASKNVTHPGHIKGTEWFSDLNPLDLAMAMSR